MEELPTERTATMMTRFMTEPRAGIPALVIAMTNGEALVSAEEVALRSRSSVYGTSRPTSDNDTI